jgi:hypothetical protein
MRRCDEGGLSSNNSIFLNLLMQMRQGKYSYSLGQSCLIKRPTWFVLVAESRGKPAEERLQQSDGTAGSFPNRQGGATQNQTNQNMAPVEAEMFPTRGRDPGVGGKAHCVHGFHCDERSIVMNPSNQMTSAWFQLLFAWPPKPRL